MEILTSELGLSITQTYNFYIVFFPDKVNIENLTTGSPTCPPYVLMLEWCMDVTRWYSNLYPFDLKGCICFTIGA